MIRRGRARVWKQQVVPYVREVVSRTIWRMEGLGYSEEDVLHEAFFVYERCLTKYGTVLGDNGKLHPLFRVSISNFVTDLAAASTKKGSIVRRGVSLEDLLGQEEGYTEGEGTLAILLKEAPKEILEVINLFFNTPAELMGEVSAFVSKKHSRGFKSNAFLCKMLGYNRFKRNLVQETKDYFS